MSTPRKNIYFPARILDYLKERSDDSLSARVTAIVDRYRELMQRAEPITDKFTARELKLIWEVTAERPEFGQHAVLLMIDWPTLIRRHGNDAKLAAKMEALTPFERVQLIEHIETLG